MSIYIEQIQNRQQAQSNLEDTYPFVTELEVPPVDNDLHWHSFDAQFYIVSGQLRLTDKSGQTHFCGAGDMVTVPTGTLHQEHSKQGYSIVFGASVTPDEFGDPVDRPAATLA